MSPSPAANPATPTPHTGNPLPGAPHVHAGLLPPDAAHLLPPQPLDAPAVWRALVRTVLTTTAAVAAVLAAAIVLTGRADWWPGYAAATTASALAAGLSLIPLAWGLRRGYAGLLPATLAAAGLRALVSIGGCSLAVLVGKYPAAPTLLLMLPYYLALLSAETACLAKAGVKRPTTNN